MNKGNITKSNQKELNKDETDETVQKRMERRRKQKQRKSQLMKVLPTLGQKISFRKYDSDIWQHAKVTGVFKKNSVHKNFKQLTFDDDFKADVDFENIDI